MGKRADDILKCQLHSRSTSPCKLNFNSAIGSKFTPETISPDKWNAIRNALEEPTLEDSLNMREIAFFAGKIYTLKRRKIGDRDISGIVTRRGLQLLKFTSSIRQNWKSLCSFMINLTISNWRNTAFGYKQMTPSVIKIKWCF